MINPENTDLVLDLYNAGLEHIVDEAYAELDSSGVWPGEFSIATRALALVAGSREATFSEQDAALRAVKDLVGKRPLSPELEQEISDAADQSVLRHRTMAARFSGLYIFLSGVNHEVDDTVAGGQGTTDEGRVIRRLPFSRIEFVVKEKLGLNKTDAHDTDEVLSKGIVAVRSGPDAQSAFAAEFKDTSWLFKNADPADYR